MSGKDDLNPLLIPFGQANKCTLAQVGVKGLSIGSLWGAGFDIPDGYCLTTVCFERFVRHASLPEQLKSLHLVLGSDRPRIKAIAKSIRDGLLATPIPEDIIRAIRTIPNDEAFTVLATTATEDTGAALFFRQQKLILNIIGSEALLAAIKTCWIELYSDQAVLYRIKNGLPRVDIPLAVVIQKMGSPICAGVMFTADPLTQNRDTMTIYAGWGLRETLNSATADQDLYRVDKPTFVIQEKDVPPKKYKVVPDAKGGTRKQTIESPDQHQQILNGDQIHQLALLGKQIATHFGQPQEIEWAYSEGKFFISYSLPMVGLYPQLIDRVKDGKKHLYLSLQQLLGRTKPINPLGQSVIKMINPLGKKKPNSEKSKWVKGIGGRIYLDISELLRIWPLKIILPRLIQMADENLAQNLLQAVDDRFVRGKPNKKIRRFIRWKGLKWVMGLAIDVFLLGGFRNLKKVQGECNTYMTQHIAQIRARLKSLHEEADSLSAIKAELHRLLPQLYYFLPKLVAGLWAKNFLVYLMGNPENLADIDAISRGLKSPLTAEMDRQIDYLVGLVDQFPAVKDFIEQEGEIELDGLNAIEGGDLFVAAVKPFLQRYGWRGVDEIDLTQPRWKDNLTMLFRVILGRLPGEGEGRHKQQQQVLIDQAKQASARLIKQAKKGILGPVKGLLVGRSIQVWVRLSALRAHPHFFILQVMDFIHDRLRLDAKKLQAAGAIDHAGDIKFLFLHEIIAYRAQQKGDLRVLVDQRQMDSRYYAQISPPQLVTQTGEILAPAPYLPGGAWVENKNINETPEQPEGIS